MSENKNPEFLAHYGVLGMKWGVRRYQNEDGTLKNPKRKKSESSTWKPNEAPYLSDDELNRRNNRLQRENQYKQLTRTRTQKAFDWIKKTCGTILVGTAIVAAKGKVGVAYKEGIAKYGPKIAAAAKQFISKYSKAKVNPTYFTRYPHP